MRLRKEIVTECRNNLSNFITINQKLLLEVLLDIRDQNEIIKSHLNGMKKYSVNSNDINISKIWSEEDNKL